MKARATSLVFSLSLTLLCSSVTFSQDEEATEATSTAPIAYVYLQVAKGVNVYSESAAGKLTLVKGSPFKVSGQIEGITGSHLLSVGTTILHSYQIASSGAVGKAISSINTAEYDSQNCGPTTGNKAALDHSGKYFYVQLGDGEGGGTNCVTSDWQTYKIGSNGDFTFIGNYYTEGYPPYTPLIIDSSDKFAYDFDADQRGNPYFVGFYRARNGDLSTNSSFTGGGVFTDPNPPYYLEPMMMAADPDEHLAVVMFPCYSTSEGECDLYPQNLQLASFTIDRKTGDISSTNTEDNAPLTAMTWANSLNMSDDGKFVAIGGSGVQVFNFNGAALPINLATVVQGVQFDQVTWDKADHLFALSYEAQELYVFSVSKAKGVVEIGEPMIVPGAYGLTGIIVVPK